MVNREYTTIIAKVSIYLLMQNCRKLTAETKVICVIDNDEALCLACERARHQMSAYLHD